MLFQNIAALVAKGVKLVIICEQADDGKLEVSLLPESQTGKSGVALVAKSFVATPEELDAEFAEVIAGYSAKNASLKDQVAAFDEQIAKAATDAEASVKAAQAAKPANKPAGGSSSKKSQPVSNEMLDEEDDDEPTGQAPSKTPVVEADPVAFTL